MIALGSSKDLVILSLSLAVDVHFTEVYLHNRRCCHECFFLKSQLSHG